MNHKDIKGRKYVMLSSDVKCRSNVLENFSKPMFLGKILFKHVDKF